MEGNAFGSGIAQPYDPTLVSGVYFDARFLGKKLGRSPTTEGFLFSAYARL